MSLNDEIAAAKHLWGQGQIAVAEQRLRKIAKKNPRSIDANYFLGTLLAETARYEDGIRYLRLAETIEPLSPWVKINLATAHQLSGDESSAMRVFEDVLALGHRPPELLNNLGALYTRLGFHGKAIALLQGLVAQSPAFAFGFNTLGRALAAVGLVDDAFDACRSAVALAPGDARMVSNLLMISNYVERFSGDEIRLLHQEALARFPEAEGAWPVPAEGGTTVGLVSPDFGEHSVSFFLRPLLENLQGSGLTAILYSTAKRSAAEGLFFQNSGHVWRDVSAASDAQLVATIRADGVDVLIDLAGHTARNRMGVFAQRAARKQVAFLGYPSTSGIHAMDFALTDATLDPVETASHYVEKRYRLDFFCAYAPPEQAPELNALPARSCGFFTFGIFHNAAKWSAGNLARWARLVAACPGSRILMMANGACDGALQKIVLAAFESEGVDASRVMLRDAGPMARFLEAVQEVDLCLDALPWGGHTVTCHALWMGVPTLTIAGTRRASRMGAALLKVLDLEGLIAQDEADQRAIVGRLFEQREWLEALRLSLRARMASSRLCDGQRFAADFARAITQIAQ